MHVRVAWEIYHHQQKSGEAKGSIATAKATTDLLRPPTHLFSPSVHSQRASHEMSSFPPSLAAHHRPGGYDQSHHGSLFTAPTGHLGKDTEFFLYLFIVTYRIYTQFTLTFKFHVTFFCLNLCLVLSQMIRLNLINL